MDKAPFEHLVQATRRDPNCRGAVLIAWFDEQEAGGPVLEHDGAGESAYRPYAVFYSGRNDAEAKEAACVCDAIDDQVYNGSLVLPEEV